MLEIEVDRVLLMAAILEILELLVTEIRPIEEIESLKDFWIRPIELILLE